MCLMKTSQVWPSGKARAGSYVTISSATHWSGQGVKMPDKFVEVARAADPVGAYLSCHVKPEPLI